MAEAARRAQMLVNMMIDALRCSATARGEKLDQVGECLSLYTASILHIAKSVSRLLG